MGLSKNWEGIHGNGFFGPAVRPKQIDAAKVQKPGIIWGPVGTTWGGGS